MWSNHGFRLKRSVHRFYSKRVVVDNPSSYEQAVSKYDDLRTDTLSACIISVASVARESSHLYRPRPMGPALHKQGYTRPLHALGKVTRPLPSVHGLLHVQVVPAHADGAVPHAAGTLEHCNGGGDERRGIAGTLARSDGIVQSDAARGQPTATMSVNK